MRQECSGQDAHEVIEIMNASMVDVYESGLDKMDFGPSQSQGKSSGSQYKQFVAYIQEVSKKRSSYLYTKHELTEHIEVIYQF